MNNTEPTAEENASQATIEELVDRAHEHYLEASSEIQHWNSLIPKALDFYKNWHQSEHNLQGLKEESWQLGYRQGLQSIADEIDSKIATWKHIQNDSKNYGYEWNAARERILQLKEIKEIITKHLDQ